MHVINLQPDKLSYVCTRIYKEIVEKEYAKQVHTKLTQKGLFILEASNHLTNWGREYRRPYLVTCKLRQVHMANEFGDPNLSWDTLSQKRSLLS